MTKKMRFLHLKNKPIFEQLQIEEALLRLDENNWCIVGEGFSPSIVMGISGQSQEWIDQAKIADAPIPVIKRFSGGGTVLLDSNTFVVSFIFQKKKVNFSFAADYSQFESKIQTGSE